MKIIVVGCGNAFSKKNFNQSFLIEENGRKMLIDAGTKVPAGLDALGIDIKDIDDIYVSHLHADHIGALEEIAFTRYDWINKPRCSKGKGYAPVLIGNEQLLKDLWNYSLKGGLNSMEGFVASIDTFFETKPIQPNETFEWQGWTVELVQQIHIMSGSVIMPSFGIMFSKEGHKTVYFTTDSQHCSPRQLEDFYRRADIIFQDCECVGVDMLNRKFIFGTGVHANYAQLAGWESANAIRLSKEIKAKMYLSHFQDFVEEDKDFMGQETSWSAEAFEDGFAGIISTGETFEV
jgi:ribonuclease BN (tRNA processing enzyme)